MEEYRHQVGGHCKLIKPKDSSKVYKPLIENEYIFYEKLKNFRSSSAESSPLQILKKFIPKFYGVVDIAVDSFSDLSSETFRRDSKMIEKSKKKNNNMKYIRVNRNEKKKDYILPNADSNHTETEALCNNESVSINLNGEINNAKVGEIDCQTNLNEHNNATVGDIANQEDEKKWIPHIILEDLVNGFKRPCVLDIKMGKRQRKIGASLEKKKRQVEKSFKTTSHSLGFRLCGCQHYNKLQDTLFYKDKYWGRSLSKENIPWAIRNWFWNGTLLYDELIPILLEKLHVFFNCIVELRHYRFWSSSLLWVFDGGLNDKKERSNSLDIRMIDFANTIYLQDNPSVDEEYIFGLRNLIYFIQILYNCIHNIYFLPYEINTCFYSENYKFTKKNNSIQPFYHNIVKGRVDKEKDDDNEKTNIKMNTKCILNDNYIDTFDWKKNKIINNKNNELNNYNENIKKEIIFDKLNECKENLLKDDPKYINHEQNKIESDSKIESKRENNGNDINSVMIQCLNDNKIYSKNLIVKKLCSKLSNLSIYKNYKEKNINGLNFTYLSLAEKTPKIYNRKIALKNINCNSDSFLLFKKSLNLNSVKKIVKKKNFQMCEKSNSCTDVFISIKKNKKKKKYYEKKINMYILRKYNEFYNIKRFTKSTNQMNYLRNNNNNMSNSRHSNIYKKNKIYNKFYKINKNKKIYYSNFINKPLEEFNVYSEYKNKNKNNNNNNNNNKNNNNMFFIDGAILNNSKKKNIFFNKHIKYELKRKNLIIPLTETNENYKYIRRSLSEPNIYKFNRFIYTSNNFNTTEIHYSNLIKNKLINVPIYGHIYGFISSSTNVDYFSNCSISE
ncbi:hypothetical protein YYC_01306 [Plasmodium yoelii 17X]|uniref:Kinase n=1 Tax=Plasmodium yoelii 17X TaxID=1323249 RepID=V7PPP5_PLAYE|nr:hypothetical protein YYC_01306 [Plasmodium yoelii 17X]